MNDININLGEAIINCRAAAIITSENKILLHKMRGDSFWTLAGGKIKCQETSEDAILRELKEEIATDVTVEKLLIIAENFFTFDYKLFHEFCFIYKICDGDKLVSNNNIFTNENLIYHWFNINEIPDIKIKPDFMKSVLLDMPSDLKHIVCIENPGHDKGD